MVQSSINPRRTARLMISGSVQRVIYQPWPMFEAFDTAICDWLRFPGFTTSSSCAVIEEKGTEGGKWGRWKMEALGYLPAEHHKSNG